MFLQARPLIVWWPWPRPAELAAMAAILAATAIEANHQPWLDPTVSQGGCSRARTRPAPALGSVVAPIP
jgi:hypothetical protein